MNEIQAAIASAEQHFRKTSTTYATWLRNVARGSYSPADGSGTEWGKGFADLARASALADDPAPPPPPPPPPSGKVFGVSTGWGPQTPSDLSTADLAKYMQMCKAMGCQEVRMDYTSPSSVTFDRAADAAYAAGLMVLPVFTHVLKTGLMKERVDAVLARYPQTERIEVGNEVNGSWAWEAPIDPVRYTDFLKQAYQAINGRCVTVFAGLAQYGATDATHMRFLDFYTQAKAAGAMNYCDLVGWHPYDDWGWSYNDDIANLTGKKLLLTETGYATDAGAYTGGVSESEQAAIVTKRLNDVKALDYLAGFHWYSFRDRGTGANDREMNLGLIRSDWTKKLGYDSYRVAAP